MLIDRPKPEVGDVLYSLNVGNASRIRPQTLTEMVVTKVGRKYFYAKEPARPTHLMVGFEIDGWFEKTEYSANHRLYPSRQAWIDECEFKQRMTDIRRAIDYGSPKVCLLSLDQVRALHAILELGD